MYLKLGLLLVTVGFSVSAFGAGFATGTGQTPSAGNTLVASLPDIMGTTLGFAVNGFTPWGGTTTIDQPNQIKATQAGPNKNLCLIGTGLYRTFNKGEVAVGSFVDKVYRNGTPVYTRHVASLAPGGHVDFKNHDLPFQEGMNVVQVKIDANNNVFESNESNTFEVRVMVKLDCDGDGTFPGAKPKITSPSTPAGAKPARPSAMTHEPIRRGR